MPADARVDFVMFPTYIAVSILTLFKIRYPDKAKSMEGYDDALRLGYKFATHRRLKGHGYEAQYEKTRALRILDLGGVEIFYWKIGIFPRNNTSSFALRLQNNSAAGA